MTDRHGALDRTDPERDDAVAAREPVGSASAATAFGTVALSRADVLARLAPPKRAPRVMFAERYDLRPTEFGARVRRDRNGLFFADAEVDIDLAAVDDMHTRIRIRPVRGFGPVEIAAIVVPLLVLAVAGMFTMTPLPGYVLRAAAIFVLLANGARRYRAWIERRRLDREIRARLAAFVVPDRPLELPYRKGPAQLPAGGRRPR